MEQVKPVRIQRKRSKGYDMQSHSKSINGLPCVYVGRPGKWGNPWSVGLSSCGCRSAGECDHNSFRCATPEDAVENYRVWLLEMMLPENLEHKLEGVRGQNLSCWCPVGSPCHADVLLELANENKI